MEKGGDTYHYVLAMNWILFHNGKLIKGILRLEYVINGILVDFLKTGYVNI